jgi:hypothetical protein
LEVASITGFIDVLDMEHLLDDNIIGPAWELVDWRWVMEYRGVALRIL